VRELGDLPKGRAAIGCRWVFKVEGNANGDIECYRARLAAQKFSQRPEVDIDEVYALVHQFTALRACAAVGAC
jgi:hypothetical protein